MKKLLVAAMTVGVAVALSLKSELNMDCSVDSTTFGARV